MFPNLFQHLSQWWDNLGESGRVALLAVVGGAGTVLATTWVGVRSWWHRWKDETTGGARDPRSPAPRTSRS
jgi:hypothetical protein